MIKLEPANSTFMAAMKKANIRAAVISLFVAFFALYVLFQTKVSSISKSSSLYSTVSQGSVPAPAVETVHDGRISCDRSHRNYDLCTISGPTVVDPISSTFFLVGPSSTPQFRVEKVRPYPLKWEKSLMATIKELTITSGPPGPQCQVHHNLPALVFSGGGFTGNFFHAFNDGFLPLFITANTIFPDQEFILVISKARDWWVRKYADLLLAFSKHPILDLDSDTSTHCFTSATLGLISHGFLTMDPKLVPNSKTLAHFHSFLEKALGRGPIESSIPNLTKSRPRLIFLNRPIKKGRAILNQIEVEQVAREIGFNVTVFAPTSKSSLSQAYALINSSHAMFGVHGAGLTHFLFLRPGSVFGQVVPLGTRWASAICYGNPARKMGLDYMDYNIKVNESSLIKKYDRNERVIKDSDDLTRSKWPRDLMKIYLKEQNVELDLVQFRKYLKIMYKKAKKFMKKEG